jgi:ethanolamine utilization protein EutQ (cupin superfamily)
LKKSVKVVRYEDITAEPIVEGETSSRIVTKFREYSDKFSLAVVSFAAGVVKEEGEDDKDNAGYVLEGSLELSWDDGSAELSAGSAFYVPSGKRVKLVIKSKCKILAVVSPPRI